MSTQRGQRLLDVDRLDTGAIEKGVDVEDRQLVLEAVGEGKVLEVVRADGVSGECDERGGFGLVEFESEGELKSGAARNRFRGIGDDLGIELTADAGRLVTDRGISSATLGDITNECAGESAAFVGSIKQGTEFAHAQFDRVGSSDAEASFGVRGEAEADA